MLTLKSRNTRRGVLLLIVLALLVVFAVMALVFVLLTAHHYRAVRASQQTDEATVDPSLLIYQGIDQVLRGSTSEASALRVHSLLEDKYGNGRVKGRIANGIAIAANGHIVEIGAEILDESSGVYNALTTPLDYVGRVITFTDGNAKNTSRRIIGYNVTSNAFQVLMGDWPVLVGEDGQPGEAGNASLSTLGSPATDDLLKLGDVFVINGPDFGGTGFGYDSATGDLGATYNARPVALLPNVAPYLTGLDPAGDGGANEDYDAVDYQNMLLAMVSSSGSVAVPSLHRPELVRYWTTVESTLSPELQHQIILRPLSAYHPTFDGSNPKFNPAWDGSFVDTSPADGICDYAWDVDNDGDGVNDSIWVDLGMPTFDSEGTTYKPLFAILCVDLDGRLNINLHGSAYQAYAGYYGGVQAPNAAGVASAQPFFANGATSAALPRTIGFGPADVNLGPLFADGDLMNNSAALQAYQLLFAGQFAADPVRTGRYGSDGVPGFGGDDVLGQNVAYQYWNNCWATLHPTWALNYWGYLAGITPYIRNGYGTPIDMKAKGALGLDVRGQPIYAQMNEAGDQIDDPYEMDFQRTSDADRAFETAELEWLLRYKDSDASQLPQSLKLLRDLSGHPSNVSAEVTTETWDVPTPAMRLTPDLRNRLYDTWTDSAQISAATRAQILANVCSTLPREISSGVFEPLRPNATLVELLIVRLAAGLDQAGVASTAIPQHVTSLLRRLLPLELGLGVKIDLNRPFGNGLDDNGNGVVDEPAEAYAGEVFPQLDTLGNPVTTVAMNHTDGIDVNADGTVDSTDRAMARQLFARQLYVLMLLVTDYEVENPSSLKQSEKDEARLIAQWVVNVADFRDRDSIMTPFEFDYCPFTDESTTPDGNTWDVDCAIGTTASPSTDDTADYRGLVWGCERPELLITETLALHDRRTEDLAFSSSSGSTNHKVGDTTPDDDFDQRFKPEGSLFVELYNPWTSQEPSPAELCEGSTGVDVAKIATSGTSSSPIWRLAIVAQEEGDKNPDDPQQNVPLDRTVYFVGDGAILPDDGSSVVQYHPSAALAAQIAPIMPGRYAVIGPGEPGSTGANTTYLGYRTDGTYGNSQTRRIVLDPTGSPSVAVYSDGVNDDLDSVSIQNVVPVIINEPRLSLTTTAGSYPNVDPNGDAYVAATGYPEPYDQPLDFTNPMWDGSYVKLKDNGVFPKVRVIHLQRLANPLLPYEEHTNPYQTVDTATVDLHCFNGITADKDIGSAVNETGDIDDDDIVTRERGETTKNDHPDNLWTQEPLQPLTEKPKANGSLADVSDHYVTAPLHHTLGYLNWELNYGHESEGPRDASLSELHVGDPRGTPFPWLAWKNRPFTSPMELMEVTTLSSRDLLRNPADLAASTLYPFGKTLNLIPTGATPNPFTTEGDSFSHLLNFAFSGTSGSFSANWGCTPGTLYRVFDLVEVPSPFPQEYTQADAGVFANYGGHTFFPPFNRIPNYRKPGLVNINTVFSPVVWQGLMNYFPSLDTSAAALAAPTGWQAMQDSRRGFDVANAAQYPTSFANPFRSASNAQMVPPLASSGTWPTADKGASGEIRGEVSATLLRQDPNTASTGMMFEFESKGYYETLYGTGSTDAENANRIVDSRRNPYFRYQMAERLGNLVTTRSNVYAVWITVGFFEATSLGTTDTQHPDGYQLGAESTTLSRHRAFFLIDRSIPVGFDRGQQLNVEKTILLKRFIE